MRVHPDAQEESRKGESELEGVVVEGVACCPASGRSVFCSQTRTRTRLRSRRWMAPTRTTHTHTCRLLLARTRVSASASLTTSTAFALSLFPLLLPLLLLPLSLLDFFLLAAISFLEQLHTGRTQASSNPSGGRHCSETASVGVCHCSRADVTERASIQD